MQEMRETAIRSLDWEDSLEKEMTPDSSVLAWKIPWTEEPGRPQSLGHKDDWGTKHPRPSRGHFQFLYAKHQNKRWRADHRSHVLETQPKGLQASSDLCPQEPLCYPKATTPGTSRWAISLSSVPHFHMQITLRPACLIIMRFWLMQSSGAQPSWNGVMPPWPASQSQHHGNLDLQ